jgi:hypothetical protein
MIVNKCALNKKESNMSAKFKRQRLFVATLAALSALAMGIATAAYAATLTLNPGDTVTIQPNYPTTVTCAAGPAAPDCTRAIATYQSRYNACKRSYPASTCYNNEWPAFKSRAPACVVDAFDVCVQTCEESYPSSTCFNNCR